MKAKDLFSRHGIKFVESGHHHCSAGWIQLDCPFCSKGTGKWRLGYNLGGGYFSCWTCGPHSATETLAELLGISPTAAFKLKGGLDFEKVKGFKPSGKLVPPDGKGPMLQAHRKYLERRGFDADQIERLWRVEGIGVAPRLAWRLYIPIYYKGTVVSWTTRAIGATDAKYISAKPEHERMPHKDLLYGEDYATTAVVIVEGPTDVWAIGPGAVCTFGLVYSREQVLKLSRYPVRVVCFDNEPVANKRARRLATELESFDGSTYRVTLSQKDAAESLRNGFVRELDELRERFLGR